MVKRSELQDVVRKLQQTKILSVDTETTGLRVWDKDFLFSIIIADKEQEYYFNFQHYEEMDQESYLTKDDVPLIQEIFQNPEQTIYMANAKFDLAVLSRIGIEIKGITKDVLMMNRLIYNEHLEYSLAACAKRMGFEKSDAVEEFIDKENLWVWLNIPGKKIRSKQKFFSKVPLRVIVPYGKKDARITFDLGEKEVREIVRLSENGPEHLNMRHVLNNEIELTRTCFEMERVGIKIDKEYCLKAYFHSKQSCDGAAKKIENMTGVPFVDSNKSLAEIFSKFGEIGAKTEKGNPSFTEAALRTIQGEAKDLAESVLEYREFYKKATTYYQSFLYFADSNSIVHANILQAGTTTGRFSYRDPNLQNIPKEEEGELKVRKAFVPREDFCFVEFDYKQMEYRLMAEYANEPELVTKINAGVDIHEATAQMMGVDRRTAKTLNFMLLYGGGAQKLATALSIGLEEAKALKSKYFMALPKIKKFIRDVTGVAERRGFVINWLGRRCHFPNRDFSYKAPNALIQGGTADIVKVAMNKIYADLRDAKSRMVLQVHDSLLFEIHKDEMYILDPIKFTLEHTFPSKNLTMEVSMSHSWKSWGELIEGAPK